MKDRQPSRRIVADLRPNAVKQLDRFRPSGQYGERIIETAEIKLRHHRIVALLDQEPPAFGRELLLDQAEFRVGQMESVDIVRARSPRIRQEDLRRALLDNGLCNGGSERVAWRLRAEHHDAVLLADGFQLVVGEIPKCLVAERLPELVDIDDQAPAVDQTLHAMEQVHHERRANRGMIEQSGHVEADKPGVETDRILLAVQYPAERCAPAPSLQAGADSFAILLAEKSPQGPEGAFRLPQVPKCSQSGIDLLLLGHCQRAVFRCDELPDKFAQEGKIGWRQLQRLERRAAGPKSIVERQIGPPGGTDENLGAAVLVEEDVSSAEQLGMRRVVNARFTPKAVRARRDDVERIGVEIVDAGAPGTTSVEMDFVERIAAPFPLAVIAWLLGVPRDDWDLLFRWTNEVIGKDDPDYRRAGESPGQTIKRARGEVHAYFRRLIEQRRHDPRDDLVSDLIRGEVGGAPLTDEQLVQYCELLVEAGNETTRNAISGAVLAFSEYPDQWEKLRDHPELLSDAVEEILRWVSPISHFTRTAAGDYELRGVKIRAGEQVALYYASANRDDDVFDDPFAFRIDRRPNPHLAFGFGEHFCMGAHVARVELETIFRHLLGRFEWFDVTGPVARLSSITNGSIKRLPLRNRTE